MNSTLLIFIVLITIAVGHSPFKHTKQQQNQFNFPTQADPSNSINADFSSKAESKLPFDIIYQWKNLDFDYPTYERRQQAIATGEYNPETNLPLGIEIVSDRIFITTPRWKDGVPASLGWLPNPAKELSPLIKPYPSWEEQGDPYNPDCNKLMSVYRLNIDECGRLWAIDSGVVNATVQLNQICPPKIVAFDLATDERIITYEIPPDQVKQDSLHSNIVIDVRDGMCHDAYAYVADVWRFGIVVYSLAQHRSWRVTSHLFYPNPLASDYNLYGLNFQWSDGVFGMSLSPITDYNDRIVFFHPMSSYKEFMVSASILRDESLWTSGTGSAKSFVQVGDRGPKGQSSTSGIDRSQVMFFTLVHLDGVGCWDTNKQYTRSNLGIVAQNITGLMFPNDLKIDHEIDQGVWVIKNRLPIYLYSQLDFNDVNFYILRGSVKDSIRGSVCDPLVPAQAAVRPDIEECY